MIGFELQRALDAFPLEAWAREAGFEGAGGGEYTAACPRCGKGEKLVLNVRKGRWHCWVCQRKEARVESATGITRFVTVEGGGGLLRLIAWWFGCSMGDAARSILRVSRPGPLALAALPEIDAAASVAADDDGDLPPPSPPDGAVPLSKLSLMYLESRRVSEACARSYGVFSCEGGRYDRRVVFPAWDARGQLLYWQARATWRPEEDELRGRRHVKVLNPPRPEEGAPAQLTSEHTVFNLHRAVEHGRGHVVLCEGPISAIQAGDDAVALWGKALYPAQLRALLRAGVGSVDVMFDGPTSREPQGAWADAERLVPLLRLFFRSVGLVRVPAGDPGDYDRATNARFRAQRLTASKPPGVMQL